jgi:glycyl-tRNA synthetase beta chain
LAGPTEKGVPGYEFLPTVIACTRPINIIKGFEGDPVDEKLLAEKGEPAEKALWQAYQDALAKADQCNLMELFMLLKDMRPTIDRFFDEVLVMHEDEKIRRNRLALCWNINHNLFRRLADFSLIVQT